jgi:hypothetical protein
LKLKISSNYSRSKTVVVTKKEFGSNGEFSSIVKAYKYMGIFPNNLIDCVLKKPIKEIHLVVNNAVYITRCYPIKKKSVYF